MPGAIRPKVTAKETTAISGTTDTRIVYNNFTFPAAITTRLNARPVSTTSERATKRIDYTLSVDCILTIDDFKTGFDGSYSASNLSALGKGTFTDPTDYTMDYVYQVLVRHLTAKGEALTVYGTGIGQIYINPNRSDSIQNDINNGPTPTQLEVVRIDAAKAFHINWSVNFSLSPCDNNQTIGGIKVNEFDFSIHYTIDNNGMMVRNVYGTVEFPNYVSRSLTKFNPEDGVSSGKGLKDKILTSFPMPAGFERRTDFTTNPNRTRIQFSITDTEIASDNAYFPGTVRMQATHTVSNPKAFQEGTPGDQSLWFESVISGSVEIAPGRNKFWGWNAIVSIIRSRLDIASQNYAMLFFGITESIYERRLTFHISYQTTFNPNDFFARTKLFQPILSYLDKPVNITVQLPGVETTTINASQSQAFPVLWEDHNKDRKDYTGPFGYDGISVFKPEESVDRVLTICDNPETSGNLPKEKEGTKKKGTDNKKTDSKPGKDSKTTQRSPFSTNVTSPTSYLRYKNEARIESSFNVAVHGVIGESDSGVPKEVVNPSNQDAPATFMNKGVELASNRKKTLPNVAQARGTGNHRLIVEGEAVRVGFRIAIPKVDAIEGVTGEPQLLTEESTPSQLAGFTADGIPIYRASWKRVYCLPQLGVKVTLGAVPVQFQTADTDFLLPDRTSRNLPSSATRNG